MQVPQVASDPIRSDIAYGEDSDMFFDLIGEPMSALESETWGSIKTLF